MGFRPYVHRLASAQALCGSVRNNAGGVLIDVEGDAERVDDFCRLLTLAPPTLATIARLRVEPAVPQAYQEFSIAASEAASRDGVTAKIPPDAATCDACLAELFDPGNRRFGYPFITCTECGPRFTIVCETPYDRERTTMSAFPLCARCRREYDDPQDRRFHAEAIAWPDCGPTLVARPSSDDEERFIAQAALEAAVSTLRSRGIVALMALGGFHLACDASDQAAVKRLRIRKRRLAKPFAVMVRDARAPGALCDLSPAERAALTSPARPVVLLKRQQSARIATSVAPDSATIGLMLARRRSVHSGARAQHDE